MKATGTNSNDANPAAIRQRLATARGQEYWRSLEELACTEEFQAVLHREFPENASEWLDPVGRRGFLKLMGASLALAGLSACTSQPDDRIVPYVKAPEEIVPGKPLYFATAMTIGGFATGLLVESHMGRPTKVEGNPKHPASLGATDAFAQASILTLYDPDLRVVASCGVHQAMNRTELFLNGFGGLAQAVRVQNVGTNGHRVIGSRLHEFQDVLGRVQVAVQNRDVSPASYQRAGNLPTQDACPAGDHHRLPAEIVKTGQLR